VRRCDVKKLLIASLLLLGSLALFAQAHTGYVSILPGYQFSSQNLDNGFTGSLDAGYMFTDNVGIHLGLLFDRGGYNYPYWWGYNKEYEFKHNFEIAEVGLEIAGDMHGKHQCYGQINAGYTMSLEANEFTAGAAFGYKYFFNKFVGLNVQGAYHYVNHWKIDIWDARIGLTFRF
jgi:hypothetical protein